uniref:Uncharacterized protein n=1 Tax=Oryza rufipogon TaxID=4529 RepID=A0A0E0P5Z8_ORYRU
MASAVLAGRIRWSSTPSPSPSSSGPKLLRRSGGGGGVGSSCLRIRRRRRQWRFQRAALPPPSFSHCGETMASKLPRADPV